MRKVRNILVVLIVFVICLTWTGFINVTEAAETATGSIVYSSNLRGKGWEKDFSKKDGEVSGTTGQNRPMDATKIKLQNMPKGATIEYQVHVQDIGWMNWLKEGQVAGALGNVKKIEAIRIKLLNAPGYSITYCAHVQDIGWQAWAFDGEMAGTTGKNKKIEALKIKIIPNQIKGKIVIQNATNPVYGSNLTIDGWAMANLSNKKVEVYIDNNKINDKITYSKKNITEIGYGGVENTPNPGFSVSANVSTLSAGNHTITAKLVDGSGKQLATTSKTIKIDRTPAVEYSTHLSNVGWVKYVRGETQSNALNNRVEGIKIKLLGDFPKGAEVQYQVHVQDIGWMSWVKNDALGGTTGRNKKIEALRIKLNNVPNKSIEYNMYVQGKGWQGWAADGEVAGTTGKNKKVDAVKIRVVNKIPTRAQLYIDYPNTSTVPQEKYTVSGWAMANEANTSVRIKVDDKVVGTTTRRTRPDVIEAIKGYGGDITNPTPGWKLEVNFANYSLGNHKLTVEVLSKDGKVLTSQSKTVTVQAPMAFSSGTYGKTGLAVKGSAQGSTLPYYKVGKGKNVMFATFAIHGWEDQYARDGAALIKIAEDFKNRLLNDRPQDINNNWTIYIFPGVNRDGVYHGTTHNGPGRTTLYSVAPGNKGIDINRCWQTSSSYTRYTSDRNYNGTAPFQAYEAASLGDFMLKNKSTQGKTVTIDLHGWLNETIGDRGLGQYYLSQFGMSKHIDSYGQGYLINWARQNLGRSGVAARSALVELPPVNSQAQADSAGFSTKYYNATLNMLRGI